MNEGNFDESVIPFRLLFSDRENSYCSIEAQYLTPNRRNPRSQTLRR
jgi:hypothetical protein